MDQEKMEGRKFTGDRNFGTITMSEHIVYMVDCQRAAHTQKFTWCSCVCLNICLAVWKTIFVNYSNGIVFLSYLLVVFAVHCLRYGILSGSVRVVSGSRCSFGYHIITCAWIFRKLFLHRMNTYVCGLDSFGISHFLPHWKLGTVPISEDFASFARRFSYI